MELVKIISQHRRDFSGVYKCENCGHTETHSGYDDEHFHNFVTPNWECEKCKKSTKTLGAKVANIKTKYNSWDVI